MASLLASLCLSTHESKALRYQMVVNANIGVTKQDPFESTAPYLIVTGTLSPVSSHKIKNIRHLVESTETTQSSVIGTRICHSFVKALPCLRRSQWQTHHPFDNLAVHGTIAKHPPMQTVLEIVPQRCTRLQCFFFAYDHFVLTNRESNKASNYINNTPTTKDF